MKYPLLSGITMISIFVKQLHFNALFPSKNKAFNDKTLQITQNKTVTMDAKYVPILKVKQGEVEALGNLDLKIRKNTIPMIQFIENTNTKRAGDYVDTIIRRLTKAWGRDDNEILFDVENLKSTQLVAIFANRLTAVNRRFIPVFHNNYQEDYLDLVKNNYLNNGVCLRIKKNFMSPETVTDFIDDLKEKTSLKDSDIILMMDFENITNSDVEDYKKLFLQIYSDIKPRNLRNIIVSAGSIPNSLCDVPSEPISTIPRPEGELWNSISTKTKDKKLIYSDYGVIHPVYDENSHTLEKGCCIKYTQDKEFIIISDHSAVDLREAGEQYVNNSRILIEHPGYEGKNFSWGDGYIFDCANKEVKYNGSPLWVKITLNHHFTKIMDLLS